MIDETDFQSFSTTNHSNFLKKKDQNGTNLEKIILIYSKIKIN